MSDTKDKTHNSPNEHRIWRWLSLTFFLGALPVITLTALCALLGVDIYIGRFFGETLFLALAVGIVSLDDARRYELRQFFRFFMIITIFVAFCYMIKQLHLSIENPPWNISSKAFGVLSFVMFIMLFAYGLVVQFAIAHKTLAVTQKSEEEA